jgi:hypothetical protein
LCRGEKRYPGTLLPSEEYLTLAHLYVYLDESGKKGEHPIVSFSGLVSTFDQWRAFQTQWDHWLGHYQIPHFHAVEAVRFSRPYGTMEPGTPADRIRDILPFIGAITEGIAMGVAVAVDVRAYESIGGSLYRRYGQDPHYFAFYNAVAAVLDHYEVPVEATISLICDDDEQTAIRCYRLLKKMKRQYVDIVKRIPSICFNDDKSGGQTQAADLFAYVTRLEAQRKYLGKDYRWHPLFEAFQSGTPQRHLHFAGGFYDRADLAAEEARITADRRKKK